LTIFLSSHSNSFDSSSFLLLWLTTIISQRNQEMMFPHDDQYDTDDWLDGMDLQDHDELGTADFFKPDVFNPFEFSELLSFDESQVLNEKPNGIIQTGISEGGKRTSRNEDTTLHRKRSRTSLNYNPCVTQSIGGTNPPHSQLPVLSRRNSTSTATERIKQYSFNRLFDETLYKFALSMRRSEISRTQVLKHQTQKNCLPCGLGVNRGGKLQNNFFQLQDAELEKNRLQTKISQSQMFQKQSQFSTRNAVM